MNFLFLLVVSVIAIICFPNLAQAYIDVGSVSMLLQVILAALVGAVVSIKIYWTKICQVMKKIFHSGEPKNDA
jgi:hypothetical protein